MRQPSEDGVPTEAFAKRLANLEARAMKYKNKRREYAGEPVSLPISECLTNLDPARNLSVNTVFASSSFNSSLWSAIHTELPSWFLKLYHLWS